MADAPSKALVEFGLRYGPQAGEDGPVLFVKEVLGATPDPWQERILRAYGRRERRIAVRSAHNVGKTACAAWCILCQLLTRYPQKTVATAPASTQLSGALVPEIKKWFGRLAPPLQALFDVKAAGIYLKIKPSESFFEARTSRAEKPEALQGVHEDYVLLVGDEASAIPESVFESAGGSMAGANCTTLLMGNPTRTSGTFFDAFHSLRDMWFLEKVGYEDSSRVDLDYVESVRRQHGEDSNAFRVRCLGEFPKQDEDTLIPFEMVEAALGREIEEDRTAKRVWGLDVARFGDDRTALVERTARSARVLAVWSYSDLMQTTGRVKARWDKTPPRERPGIILVDVIGLGGGVVDRLTELGLPVRGINIAEVAASSEQFNRVRSELWWRAREWFMGQDTVLRSEDQTLTDLLVSELTQPRYKILSSGKIDVEPKSEVKRRVRGKKSPDIADAFVLTFAEDISTMLGAGGKRASWNTPLKRGLSVV